MKVRVKIIPMVGDTFRAVPEECPYDYSVCESFTISNGASKEQYYECSNLDGAIYLAVERTYGVECKVPNTLEFMIEDES